MCLITKNKIPAIALQDIHAFKVVKICENYKYWVAPYVRSIHKYDELLENDISDVSSRIFYNGGQYYEVSKGYFHSTTNYIDALNIIHYLKRYYIFTSFTIEKVIIPKGSLYYEEWDSTNICSNKIIVHHG